MNKNITVVLILVLAASCSSNPRDGASVRPMDSTRKVSEQVCTRPINDDGGNLLCREVTEAERRANIAEEERQARAQKEAAERAERERLAAERERLAAERLRLEAEATRKAQEERERQERAEAEARAKQEAREAVERECQRLEQEWLDGRALLANFVANYGTVDEFKAIAGQITAFLDKPRKVKPCPPA